MYIHSQVYCGIHFWYEYHTLDLHLGLTVGHIESYGLFLFQCDYLINIEYNKTMLNDMSVNVVIQTIC